jgi:hypothetical protein
MLEKADFRNYSRLKRTPTFNNVRKILAPVYGNYESEISKILFGTGALLYIAEK